MGLKLPATNIVVIFTTCNNQETATTITTILVDNNYAACVNIVPSIKSYYRYNGHTCFEEEVMLIIKTTKDMFNDVSTTIKTYNNYENPEILMIPVKACSKEYLDWVCRSLAQV